MLRTINFDRHPDRRLIFIGDIHGCYDELTKLLARVAPGPQDLVVSVGDIVRKGPAVERCLELWRERGYLAVLGNNEEEVLRSRWSGLLAALFARKDRELLRRGDLVDYVRSWPVAIDFPDAGVAAVHGGFAPGMAVDYETVVRRHHDIVRMRFVKRNGSDWQRVPKGKETKSDPLWAEVWDGNRTIVYGHTPLKEPRFDAKAIGIDTGCVYGRRLTAAIWQGGEWTVESVKAKRAYA
ncbi:MAG TPA: metallophosphoesterase [Thermoanaerobaculia bacterium]